MTTQNRIKTILSLAAVAILALAIGQVQAAAITVPNGEFAIYKPGTNYTVPGTFGAGGDYAPVDPGPNDVTMAGEGTVLYDDATSGTTFDLPGWTRVFDSNITDTATCPVNVHMEDSNNTYVRAFAEWSGGRTSRIRSVEPVGIIEAGTKYTLSAKVCGSGDTRVLRLRANGQEVPPSYSVDPPDSGLGDWQVISRTYSAKDLTAYIGQPMTIELGTDFPLVQLYSNFDDVTMEAEPDDPTFPSVDVGPDMISWSGQAVTLDPNVVNNDTEPQGDLTYLWAAVPDGIGDPNLDVAITGATSEEASVTITKAEPTGNATVVTMTLAVTLEGKAPVPDSMQIAVYDDACLAAKAAGPVVIDRTDVDDNCITNFKDFAVMAATWLDDYTLTEAVAG